MLGRYEHRFGELEECGHKAFIPFTVMGWPDKESCVRHIGAMIRGGASAIELGFPFSDPIADGPIIQEAAHQALRGGVTLEDCFWVIERAREFSPSTPIGLLVYYNLILAHGVKEFFRRCRYAGADAVLVADLPVENAGEVLPAACESSIKLIFLVSPVTTPERLAAIAKHAGGFIYLVSRLGVTGTGERNEEQDEKLRTVIEQIKSKTAVPVCAGFGIATPEHALKMLTLGVDGVISGSRVVEIIRSASPGCAEAEVLAYCRAMAAACTTVSVVSQQAP